MIKLILNILLIFICLGHAEAQSRKSSLELGMSQYEVLSSWGAPQDKSERESARIEVWSYPEGDLFFHEGSLVGAPSLSVLTADSIDPRMEAKGLDSVSNTAPVPPTVRPPTRELNSAEKDSVMMEVFRSVPSEPDAPAGAKPVERNLPEG